MKTDNTETFRAVCLCEHGPLVDLTGTHCEGTERKDQCLVYLFVPLKVFLS